MATAVTIGDNLARIRRHRSLTQEDLAEAAGVSVETVRKLEQNERLQARIATLNKLARALQVNTSALFGSTGRPVDRREALPELSLLDLRRALFPARGLSGTVVDGPDSPPPELSQVQEAIRAVDCMYHADDYQGTVAALPSLLVEAVTLADTSGQAEAHALVAQAHQLAGTVLTQLRRFDLAHHALDLALTAAARSGRETVGASTVTSLCWLLLRQRRLDEAERLAIVTADQVEPSFTRADAVALATWGWLMLRVAAAASRNARTDEATDALDAAAAAATRIEGDGARAFVPGPATIDAFCPIIVAMKRVECAVIAGDTARALTLAAQVPPSGRPTSNNRNRHFLDVARARVDQRRYSEAADVLLAVRADAPAWLSHQRYARDIVEDLRDGRRRAMTEELTELAELVGLEV